MRLEIYRQCSALTLFILSATAKSLQEEILGYRSIYKRAPGFKLRPSDGSLTEVEATPGSQAVFSFWNIARIHTPIERSLFYRMMLFNWKEEPNFTPTMYYERSQNPQLRLFACCIGCSSVRNLLFFVRVRWKKVIPEFYFGLHFAPWIDYCRVCENVALRKKGVLVGNGVMIKTAEDKRLVEKRVRDGEWTVTGW
ncbi:hypothetical protein BJ508DRAFT_158752 [Ascobolus immersus RN42]|uniref:Uncharacterized protein n=1 Tax=Ascobolus immersus RN42 TaxID=1160509 RepID=A0A3N4IIL5_ASCIM|nr:hypothetical protein BJ508DRAFT_158752 [Ascobolus immersus RN42]